MNTKSIAVALMSMAALFGCADSHGPRGEPCGPSTCASGEYCCNASCGICAAPGEGCIEIACLDAGTSLCGGTECAAGQRCCPGCPGAGDFCVSGPACPAVDCPAPLPGCESCTADQRCCPGCPGSGSICVSGSECPVFDCPAPPPGCESCTGDQLCCPSCPGASSFCVSASSCPDLTCPPPSECDDAHPCAAGFFCARADGCGGAGTCEPVPSGCTADCPGVCGCDGNDYCNACIAAQAGVSVAHDGTCAAPSCEGLSYCACAAAPGCEPLVDLTPGCVCPCDDPFNCTGTLCDCDCGGAQYRGCATAGRCAETEVRCDPGCFAENTGGCLACVCSG